LIVDDDAEMVRLLSRMLGIISPRCRVQTATSGEEGLALARLDTAAGDRYDLVLLDLLMPGLDGHAFVRVWNADESLKGTPIVIVSAASNEGHDFVTGVSLEVRRDAGLSVAELMRLTQASLDSLLSRTSSGNGAAGVEHSTATENAPALASS
jgi:CheY-like chemotaxis protein